MKKLIYCLMACTLLLSCGGQKKEKDNNYDIEAQKKAILKDMKGETFAKDLITTNIELCWYYRNYIDTYAKEEHFYDYLLREITKKCEDREMAVIAIEVYFQAYRIVAGHTSLAEGIYAHMELNGVELSSEWVKRIEVNSKEYAREYKALEDDIYEARRRNLEYLEMIEL